MTQITIPPLSDTPTTDDKADLNPDDYVLLEPSTSLRFNADKDLKQLHIKSLVHYMDAFFISGSLTEGIQSTAKEWREWHLLRQKVDASYTDSFRTPTSEKVHTRIVLKALLLSFRKVVFAGPGERREGRIIEWSQAPSAVSFPLECVFWDMKTQQKSDVILEADAIAVVDISQTVPEIHHTTYESPPDTQVRGGDDPNKLSRMQLELPLRYAGSFKSTADLALLAWAVHLHFPNAAQFANCINFGDAIGIYSKMPQDLLDGWTEENRGSEEEEKRLFRFYAPKGVTENGPISMSTANYVFGTRPLFFVSYMFSKSRRCRPTQDETILKNFGPQVVTMLLRDLSLYDDSLDIGNAGCIPFAEKVRMACLDALPHIMEAARDKDRTNEVLQSFQELLGGIDISKALAQRKSPLGQMAGRMKSLVREVEFVTLKHLLRPRERQSASLTSILSLLNPIYAKPHPPKPKETQIPFRASAANSAGISSTATSPACSGANTGTTTATTHHHTSILQPLPDITAPTPLPTELSTTAVPGQCLTQYLSSLSQLKYTKTTFREEGSASHSLKPQPDQNLAPHNAVPKRPSSEALRQPTTKKQNVAEDGLSQAEA